MLSAVALLRAAPMGPGLRVVMQAPAKSEAQWLELVRVLEARVMGYGLAKPVDSIEKGG